MNKVTPKTKKDLRLIELIAIALGGMIGGGIFSILGISVEFVGNATPVAIFCGGVLALLAAYAYVKLALLYKDEGAMYSFFKKTFPRSNFASCALGWFVVFGYISTLALYAFTFSSYLCSQIDAFNTPFYQKIVATIVITAFAVVNIVSVKGMGRIEDVIVYTKIILLLAISGLLAFNGNAANLSPLIENKSTLAGILIVAAVTFVAYEGFQLVIHAYSEMEQPKRNIPISIYSSIIIATALYVGLAVGMLAAVPHQTIIDGKEYALAAGAKQHLGTLGLFMVIAGALMATSSAISGTIFGASRLIAVIADDGYMPAKLGERMKVHIPHNAILMMGVFSLALIWSGGLRVILEFGSMTFIIISFLMAWTNFVVRSKTKTPAIMAILPMVALALAGILIFYFEYTENKKQFAYILGIYSILIGLSYLYAHKRKIQA